MVLLPIILCREFANVLALIQIKLKRALYNFKVIPQAYYSAPSCYIKIFKIIWLCPYPTWIIYSLIHYIGIKCQIPVFIKLISCMYCTIMGSVLRCKLCAKFCAINSLINNLIPVPFCKPEIIGTCIIKVTNLSHVTHIIISAVV